MLFFGIKKWYNYGEMKVSLNRLFRICFGGGHRKGRGPRFGRGEC